MQPLRLSAIQIAAIVGVAAMVLVVSLSPQPGSQPPNGVFIFHGERATADALLNILFYVPVGLLIGFIPLRCRAAVLVGCLVSVSMEGAQYFIPGRFPSLSDIITNSGGAAIGILAIRTLPRWVNPPVRIAGGLSLASGAGFALVCLATGYFMTPDIQPGAYVGQWVPNLPQYEPYGGSVQRVLIGEHALPSTLIERTEGIRELLLAGEPLRIWATAGPPPLSLSPIFGLVRQFRTPLVTVGVDGEDLVLRVRQRASRWRLDQPVYYARGMMSGVDEGSTLEIAAWHVGRQTCLSLNETTDCSLSPTVGSGWGLLLNPAPGSRGVHRLLSLGWLLALTLPVGFWFRSTSPSVAGAFFVFGGGGIAPILTALGPTSTMEWLAIVSGLVAGIAAHRLLRHMSPGPGVI